MLKKLSALAVAFVLTLGAAAAASAQAASPGAVLMGAVQGPDGARLPGAVITVSGEGRSALQVVAGEQGAYRVSGLQPGRVLVQARIDGFRTATREVEVAPGQVLLLALTLELDAVAETVTVVGSADRESLETPRARESGARDVGEALQGLAGVWKVRRGAVASDIVVRGYQGENVTVLIDGARLYGACPNNMDPTAFHVDFSEVDRVEIGKGPFDLKNQGGLGAAVNIVTRRPAAGLHGSAQLSAGSFGYLNPSGTLSYGDGRFAVLAGYSSRQSDGYTDGSGRSFVSGKRATGRGPAASGLA